MNSFTETGRTPRAARWTASATTCVLLWISRTLFSLLVVFPILQAVKASGMVSGPEGDAVLFRPGSLLLLELLRVGAPAFGAALRTALLLSAIALIGQLLPLAVALDLLSFESVPLSVRFQRALRLFPRFLGLGAIALLLQAALLLLSSLLSAALKSQLGGGDERLATLAPLALFALALVGCGSVGCGLDIARAALVREDCTWREALVLALTRVREEPLAVLAGGYPVATAGAFGYLCCLWLMAHLDLAHPVPLSLALSFAAHQAAVLFAVAWRVRWLRRALTLAAGQTGSNLRYT
jgi:hypothetical protein